MITGGAEVFRIGGCATVSVVVTSRQNMRSSRVIIAKYSFRFGVVVTVSVQIDRRDIYVCRK